jgi:hypothetical protein
LMQYVANWNASQGIYLNIWLILSDTIQNPYPEEYTWL